MQGRVCPTDIITFTTPYVVDTNKGGGDAFLTASWIYDIFNFDLSIMVD